MRVVVLVLMTLALLACAEPEAPVTDSAPLAAGDTEQALAERTAEEHSDDKPVASPAVERDSSAPKVIGERIAYGETDDANIYGYLAVPGDITGPVPGLIVIHEWWGLNDNIREMTEKLAEQGYAALAVDLYAGQVAGNPKEAMSLMEGLNADMPGARNNLMAAMKYLREAVGAPRVASIGWCLGGRWSLESALLMPEQLDAAVIYYGAVTDDETRLRALDMPILGLFASDDPVVPADTVESFRQAMDRLNKELELYVYPDTKHAFANPSGMAYDAFAAEDAWGKTIAFLEANLVEEQY